MSDLLRRRNPDANAARSPRVLAVALAAALAGLVACGDAQRAPAAPAPGGNGAAGAIAPQAEGTALRKPTVLEMFAVASVAHQHQDGESLAITATCSVAVGRDCWLGAQLGDGQLPAALAARAIDEIGAETVGNGAQQQVRLRCTKPLRADHPLYCQINRGGGWQDYRLGE